MIDNRLAIALVATLGGFSPLTAEPSAGPETTRKGPVGQLEARQLADPQALGACVQAAKNSGWSASGSPGAPVFSHPLQVIEAEALPAAGKAEVNGGDLAVQLMAPFGPGWSKDAQLFWSGIEPGAILDLRFPVAMPGYYSVYLGLTRAPDYAKLSTQIRGASPAWLSGATVDGWSTAVRPPQVLVPMVGTAGIALAKGDNAISIKVVGKNPSSSGYLVGVDCIAIRMLHP